MKNDRLRLIETESDGLKGTGLHHRQKTDPLKAFQPNLPFFVAHMASVLFGKKNGMDFARREIFLEENPGFEPVTPSVRLPLLACDVIPRCLFIVRQRQFFIYFLKSVCSFSDIEKVV